jgi:hypothetical protein
VDTKTEDLSCEGFSCVSERPFSLYQVLDCELVIAAEELNHPTVLVLRCRVQVVRVEPNGAEGTFGLACRLEDYMIHEALERNRASELLSLPATP